MNQADSWLAKRKRMRCDIARSFSDRSGISLLDFLHSFFDATPAPLIGDFEAQYIPDSATLDEMLAALGMLTTLPVRTIKARFSRRETFPQFAERLLRVGTYAAEKK